MNLVEINNVSDVAVGDVIVLNWENLGITARVNEIVGSEDLDRWFFKCGPVTNMTRDEDGKVVMITNELQDFSYPFDQGDPLSAYAVR